MDEILITEYDPNWVTSFKSESQRVGSVLGNDLVINIEHVGSTAVPGLCAKPIVDMLVFVHSLNNAKDKIADLEALGYAFWQDNADKTRLFFVKGLPPNGPRTHHIHIAEPGDSPDEKILFRDYLRTNAKETATYLQLKHSLAAMFPTDREEYTKAKTSYISSVLKKARANLK